MCSRFGETAQLSRPLLCGDSPQKKGHLAERVKLAFAVTALKIQKQPIISLWSSAGLIPTTLESSPEGPGYFIKNIYSLESVLRPRLRAYGPDALGISP